MKNVARTMKAIYILISVMLLFSCAKVDNPAITTVATSNQDDGVSIGALTGKWKLTEYHNLTLGSTESEPSDIKRSIVIDFLDNGNQGKMSGYTVANGVGGDYELLKDNKMKTLSFGGSKV